MYPIEANTLLLCLIIAKIAREAMKECLQIINCFPLHFQDKKNTVKYIIASKLMNGIIVFMIPLTLDIV